MTSHDQSLRELLSKCLQSGAQEPWVEFVRRAQPAIAGAVIRTLNRYNRGDLASRDIVDDLVQQTYLRLCAQNCRHLRDTTFPDDVSLLAYLRTVAANMTVDHLRANRQPLEAMPEDLPGGHPDADSGLLMDAVDRHLEACCGDDVQRDRRVFWLYYRSGLTAKAIAAISTFQLTQRGVESLILRLSRCVRKILAEGISASNPLNEKGRSLGNAR